ncbi:MAG: nitroreductase family protein [Desulfarculales bacterium]|jgi:hypothetical protein|nr:nitroreductase family protein [Desulfarculales bacterium]
MKPILIILLLAGIFMCLPVSELNAADSGKDKTEILILPPPVKTGGMPLMEALAARRSNRNISPQPLSEQQISDLLWAVWGVNRPDGRHTVPVANNRQDLAVYVVLAGGVWVYEPVEHVLIRKVDQNLLSRFGDAPLVLAYAGPQSSYASPLHVGSLYQNAGLYCASSGLANIVRSTGANSLDDVLTMPVGYKIYIVHSIGMPK